MIDDIFKNKSINHDKLLEYGFVLKDEVYQYETNVLNNQFKILVLISKDNKVTTKVYDNDSNDEFVLHLIKNSTGEFVGKVRFELERILNDICLKCFETNIFKSKQAKQVIEYIKNKYDVELEYLWEKFPNNAIWRRKDNKKWFGLLVTLSKRKLGAGSDEEVEIIVVRTMPESIDYLVDNASIFEGYHLNKKHWITICLDNSLPIKEVFKFIDNSYKLA